MVDHVQQVTDADPPGLVFQASGSQRLMVFHQPFLNRVAAHFPQADVLLGKPMPVAAAHNFYRQFTGGGFDPEVSHERVLLENGRPRRFVIARAEETAIGRDITVSLKDIRAIQLAKAALRAGAEILLRTYGVELPDRVILAGAFGSYIDKYHALAIGMLPPCEPDRVISVGNSAGDGARFALLSVGKRREAEWVANQVEYVELATDRDFQAEYVKAMAFGENT